METLKIHNSLSGEKEAFVPMEPGRVRMYVCGMTIYDYCHLGHARVMVVFDVVVRYPVSYTHLTLPTITE